MTAPNVRPLSPCAHRLLALLRHEHLQYQPPYGEYEDSMMVRGLVPVTFLHYEAGKLNGDAMSGLREIEARGIRLEWSAPENAAGALVRLA